MAGHTFGLAFAAAFIALPVAAQTPQPLIPTNGEPVVHVGLASRGADGSVRGGAYSSGDTAGDDLAGIVYLSPCQSSGASSTLRPPAAATDVWRLGGRVVSLDDEQAEIEVTWQRVREDGKDVDGETHAGTFGLRQGERETLESIHIPARGSCVERHSSLDVVYTRRPVAVRAPGGGWSSVTVGERASVTVGGGSGRASGVGGVSNVPSGGGAVGGVSGGVGGGRVTGGVSGGGGVVGGRVSGSGGIGARRGRSTVDLWLVQNGSGGRERVHHLQAEVWPFARALTFPRITIGTPNGTFSVDVECYVEEGLTPEGDPRLFVSASRRVDFAPSAGQVRDRRPVVEGSIKTAIEPPDAGEVLEFELPSIEYPGAPAVPDRLAVRLRLTPPATN